ncbi:MAG TPA: response regulator, partial [Thermoanaerobaculia bacterium]|nr:response regulator [Thermoanaerobaculia bacterium]
ELEASRDDLDHARSDADAAKGRIAELEALRDRTAAQFDTNLQRVVANITADHDDAIGEAVLQREAAKAEVRSLKQRNEELQKKVEELGTAFDAKLQKIVITSDHEDAIGEALVEREAAKAEVRTLTKRLQDLQQTMQSERDRLNQEFDTKLQATVANLTTDHENAIGNALLEREAAKAELRRITQRGDELQRTVEEEKQTRANLQAEWNDKLQKIVVHLTEDHESDIGEAMVQREAARAEVRNLTAKLAASQKQLEEALRQLALRRTALQTMPTVEQRLPTVDRSRPHVVLVVHSDAGIRAMAKHTLEQSGYIVLTAADGLEGLRTATQQKPDVVLTEPLLPKMNARELVQLMKSKRETADVKIILLNANGYVGRGGDFRADDVVRNPADFNELRTTLANVLSRSITS